MTGALVVQDLREAWKRGARTARLFLDAFERTACGTPIRRRCWAELGVGQWHREKDGTQWRIESIDEQGNAIAAVVFPGGAITPETRLDVSVRMEPVL